MLLEISATATLTTALAAWLCHRSALQKQTLLRHQHEQAITTLTQEIANQTRVHHELMDALDAAFFLVTPQETICYANRSALNLFPNRIILDRTIHEVFLEPKITHWISQCRQSQSSITKQIILPHSHLNPSPSPSSSYEQAWAIDCAPIHSADQTNIRVILRDVTASYQTEQVRKDFVANASHELRTPLAIITGYLENLLDDEFPPDPKTTKHFLGIMLKHGDRLAKIIEDMLVISRLESPDAAPLNIEPFPLQNCLQDVCDRLEPIICQQHASVITHLSPPNLELIGDPFYWTQVLFNLVENALKQNPNIPLKIEIHAETHADRTVTLTVQDNGCGIPKADLPHIFRRFYRVQKHHSQQSIKGTGLGLSIVKRIVEAHHGTIHANSTPGIQTTFTIQLPPQASPLE